MVKLVVTKGCFELLMKNESFRMHTSLEDIERALDPSTQYDIVLLERSGRLLDANTNFLQRIGYSHEEMYALSISRIIHLPQDLDEFYQTNFKFRREANSLPKAVIINKNGDKEIASFSMLRTAIDDDRICYVIILKQVQSLQPLNLFQQFSDAFLNDVNLGVLLIDMAFRLVNISDMACRVLGVNKQAVLNRSIDDVFASVPIEHQLVQRTILHGMVARNHAVSWTNNQERYELLLDSNVLKDAEGRTVGAYLIFKDVTNLRSLEQQVQRSDRLAMIGQIAAGTAHEIRNPLTSIKGFLQVLRKNFESQGLDKERGYTEVMLSEIDRINQLVNEFLLLSKPKNVSYEETDVSAVLRGILPIINNEAILHKVHLQYEAHLRLPSVVADQELLKQVFLNICKNGIEAMSDGGVLTITEKMDTEERTLHIDIHDTGPGIPSFVVDKIFDPFFTTKSNGTGLGLSVCQRIIHDIGGHIRVSSKGFGTTFTISIPYP
jgi:two-component system, sporulation sensor kinase E